MTDETRYDETRYDDTTHRADGTRHDGTRHDGTRHRADTTHRADETAQGADETGHRADESTHRADETGHRADETGHRVDDTRIDGISTDGTPGDEAHEDATPLNGARDGDDATLGAVPRGKAIPMGAVPTGEANPNGAAPERVTTLWPADDSDLRNRWQQAQLRFVEDPQAVTDEVRSLVDEAVQSMSTALTERQRELDTWSQSAGQDTEALRLSVRRYREFFDLILAR